MEPIQLLGKDKFAEVDIRVRVKGGGHVAQIYGTCWQQLAPRLKCLAGCYYSF